MLRKSNFMLDRLRRNDLHDLELDYIDNNGLYPQLVGTLSDWVQAICMNAICENSKVRNVRIREEFLEKLQSAEVGTLVELLGGFPQLEQLIIFPPNIRDSSGSFFRDDDNHEDKTNHYNTHHNFSIPAWALTGILHPSRTKLKTFVTASLNLTEEGDDLRLSKALEGNKNLEKLSIGELSLVNGKEVNLNALWMSLNTCSSMREISISLKYQQSLSDTSVSYIADLLNLPKLQMLKLDNMQLDTGQLEVFCRALQTKNTSLSRLHISRCDLTGQRGIIIGKMLRVNTSLQTLDLSNSYVDDDGCITIAHALASSNSSLKELDLRHNYSTVSSIKGAFAIGAMLGSNRSLTSLALSFQGKENNAFIAFSKVLSESNSSLKKLDIRNDYPGLGFCNNTSINDASSAFLIAKMLKSNVSLEHFVLSLHALDDNGFTAIVDALQHNTVLRTLDLRNKSPLPYETRVTTGGYKALIQMLKRNTVIESIYSDAEGHIQIEIESLLALDRKILNNPNATREEFIETIGSSSDNLNTLYYILSMNPSLCADLYSKEDKTLCKWPKTPSSHNYMWILLMLGFLYILFLECLECLYWGGGDSIFLQWLFLMAVLWSFILLSS